MESNELLASLAKMEASLNEVESARKQVESTVNASSELQKEVREYVSAVKALCVNLQSWESDLQAREGSLSHEFEEAITRVGSTCADVVRSFGTEVEKTSTYFKTKTEPVIERFTELIGKLDKHVQDLNALKDEINKAMSEILAVKESLSQISKELKDSQDEQDKALDEIKTMTSELPSSIQKGTNTVLSAISQSEQVHMDLLTQTNSKIDALAANTANIASIMNGSKDEILKSIKISQDMTSRTTNLTRWIMIIGFIITFILQIVCIVK